MIAGLRPGCTYRFVGQTSRFTYLSELSNQVVLTLSDHMDGDGDGMWDDWEQCYGIQDPEADDDWDGLPNLQEFELGTWVGDDQGSDPLDPDTDDDGFSDGLETFCGSDPLDPTSFCTDDDERPAFELRLPRLAVDPERLTFRTYAADPGPAGQFIAVTNEGGGTLQPAATTDVPWLVLTPSSDGITVGIDKRGLGRGHYQGTVVVTGESGWPVQGNRQPVEVHLWVYDGSKLQDEATPTTTPTPDGDTTPTATLSPDPERTPTTTPTPDPATTPTATLPPGGGDLMVYLPLIRRE
ncbi:MAG: hypothetical protein HC884_05800 [Chloroflexaceae bacterium]|nr:hypothetical protein [Chloroflexaceae bacterium]